MNILDQNGEVTNYEVEYSDKNNSRCIGLISGQVIKLDGDKCILGSIRDITDRKKAEEKLNSYFDQKKKGRIVTGIDMLVDLVKRKKKITTEEFISIHLLKFS